MRKSIVTWKWICLIFLTWSASGAGAQKQIPDCLSAYLDKFPVPAQQMITAGFAQKTESDIANLVQSRFSTLQLDSVISYYEEDAGGGMPEITPFSRSVFTYPQEDIQVILESAFDEGIWYFQNRFTIQTDAFGRSLSFITEEYDQPTGSWLPAFRLLNFPHGTSADLVDSSFFDVWSEELTSWQSIIQERNTFDEQDLLLNRTSVVSVFGVPVLFRDTYTYDANGNPVLIESVLVDGEDEIPSGRTEFNYSDGALIEEIFSVPDEFGVYIPETRMTYTYTPSAQLETEMAFGWDIINNSWLLTQTDQYSYDSEDRLTEQQTDVYFTDGTAERDLVTYSYIEDAFIHQASFYIYDFAAEAFVLDYRSDYYYQEITSSVFFADQEVTSLSMSPNPVGRDLTLDIDSDQAIVQFYDRTGRLTMVKTWIQGQGTLDVSALYNGVYYLAVKTEKMAYFGKLVKR